MPYKDKDMQAASARRHYEKNREAMKARAVAQRQANKVAIKALILEVKSVPCMDCNGTFISFAMDFDRRDGEQKEFNISEAWHRGIPIARVIKEIAKCDVVCATCHRIRTWNRSQGIIQA